MRIILGYSLCLLFTILSNGYCINPCEETEAWGFACESCEKMVTCINTSGNWTSIPIGYCNTTDGWYCNRSTRNCSRTARDCNVATTGKFECTGEGIFPDPYNCRNYYACSKPENSLTPAFIKMTCDKGSAFSASINDCVANLTCVGRQFDCDTVGNIGPWPGSKRVFYVCADEQTNDSQSGDTPNVKPKDDKPSKQDDQKLDDQKVDPKEPTGRSHLIFPKLYKCPPDQIFATYKCVKTDNNLSYDEIIQSPEQNSFTCPLKGLKPDPNNCRAYIYCNSQNQKIGAECPPSSHFSEIDQSCVFGKC